MSVLNSISILWFGIGMETEIVVIESAFALHLTSYVFTTCSPCQRESYLPILLNKLIMNRAPSASSSSDKPQDFSLKWQHVTTLVGLSIVPSVVAVTLVEATVATVDALSMPRRSDYWPVSPRLSENTDLKCLTTKFPPSYVNNQSKFEHLFRTTFISSSLQDASRKKLQYRNISILKYTRNLTGLILLISKKNIPRL